MFKPQKSLLSWSRLYIGVLLTAFILILNACTPAVQDGADEPLEQPENEQSDVIESPDDTPTPMEQMLRSTVRATELIRKTPIVPVTPSDPSPPVTGEVPASLLDDIRADLAQLSGVDQESIFVIQDQAITWSDGSLGCPQPGVFYTQALVPGYWVVLQVGEKQYDYRASESGYFFLCEDGDLPFFQPKDQ